MLSIGRLAPQCIHMSIAKHSVLSMSYPAINVINSQATYSLIGHAHNSRPFSQTNVLYNDKSIKKKSTPEVPSVRIVENGIDMKAKFKELCTLYGPVFVVCHISVSLMSLGLLTTLVRFSIDLSFIIDHLPFERILDTSSGYASEGGKFAIAYIIHKLLFPIRLGTSALLTRYISKKFKLGSKPK